MVVANGVLGDSRVQKAAWSAAEDGWDTVVVGLSGDAQRHDGSIGAARLVLVPCPQPAMPLRLARAALVRAQRFARQDGPPPRRLLWRLLAPRSVTAGLPRARDLRRCLAPALVEARPDLLHAHDHTSLPAALAALSALDRDGGRVPLVYDAHEFVPGLPAPSPVWAAAADHAERAGAARADAVITVSDLLADQLVERLALPARPVVVANAPLVDATGPAPAVEGIRSVVGVDEGVPLLVYAGGVAPQRGLSTVVHALADLPDVHLALVSAPSPWLDDLLDLAGRRGVGDRVHVAPYVSAEQVPAYLAGGDAGVIPLLHSANHEVAMSTKWYDYAHAGLPVVVSDVRSMARECRRLGNGEVFTSGDATSLAAAVRAVLADPQRYRRAYSSEVLATGTWQHQALGMLALYRTLTGAAPTRGAPTTFAVRSGQPGR